VNKKKSEGKKEKKKRNRAYFEGRGRESSVQMDLACGKR
jgi:hypothetical protein